MLFPEPTAPAIQPRKYQLDAFQAVKTYLEYRDGNPCVVLPTGAGKTILIVLICQWVQSWGGRVLILAHVKELLQQAADKLTDAGVKDVGVYSAGLDRKEKIHSITVAGIQSIYQKAREFEPFDLIILDECQLLPPDGEGMYRTFLAEARKLNTALRLVGLTATPYRLTTGELCGEDQLLRAICFEIGVLDLINKGFLCPLTSKCVQDLDTSSLHIRGGEFVQDEVSLLMQANGATEAAVEKIKARTTDRKSVLVFCAGVEHAIDVRNLLDGDMVTGETPSEERAAIIRRFKSGETKYLVNVNVLCLDEQTEILTDRGWCGIDEMSQDHLIAAWGMDESIVFTPPKTIVRRNRMPHEQMVSLRTNGIDIRVTSNHRMVYKKGNGAQRRWAIESAVKLVNRPVSLPASGWADVQEIFPEPEQSPTQKQLAARIRSLSYVFRTRDGMSAEDARRIARSQVIERATMAYKAPSCLTAAECQLIGFWIGDGSKSGGRITFAQSEAYPDNIEWIDALLDTLNITHSRERNPPATKSTHHSIRWSLARGTGGKNQKVPGYFRLEPYFEKNGSPLLWGLNRTQLLALLDGLWIADGLHHAKIKTKAIASTQKKLFDLLQAICACRGIKARINRCGLPRKSNHRQQWSFSWSEKRVCNTFYKKRLQLEEGFKEERVWCVTSSTGQIITRRNGKVAVVGNTTGFDAPNTDCVVLLRPTNSPGLYYQMVGRGFRLSPAKKDCLVLDFGGNIQRHGPINAIRPKAKPGGKKDSAPATKVCPTCDEVVLAGVRTCVACGHVWPLIAEAKHGSTYSDDEILAEDEEELPVYEVRYSRHEKKDAPPDHPATLRVDYVTTKTMASSWRNNSTVSEWVCIEHDGFAGNKARLWWGLRSNDPFPKSARRAAEIGEGGGLATALKIIVAPDPKNPKYNRIKSVSLGPKPEPVEVCECGGEGCEKCDFEFEAPEVETEINWDDLPF